MSLTYCTLLGLQEGERAARLRACGLDAKHRPVLEALHRTVLSWTAPAVASAFTRVLSTWQEYVDLLGPEERRRGFAARHERLLLELHRAPSDPRWFDERLRDALGFARAGVPLSTHICAMGQLHRLVLDAIPNDLPDDERRQLQAAVLSVFTLDLSLAGDSYRLVHTDDFRAAVDALHDRLTADPLTGVSTRAHLLTSLRFRLNGDGPMCLILADLDHFKQVNDAWGHLAGDAVLRTISARIRGALRETDLVGRLGGEEFALVLDGATLSGARALAERVRACVSATPCTFGDAQIPMSLSQGVAMARPGDTMESLIDRADRALYAAKRAGRNRVELEAGASDADVDVDVSVGSKRSAARASA